jgi:hypothetical protein
VQKHFYIAFPYFWCQNRADWNSSRIKARNALGGTKNARSRNVGLARREWFHRCALCSGKRVVPLHVSVSHGPTFKHALEF